MGLTHADYENVFARCPHCREQMTFNRVSDLKDTDVITGREVLCLVCADKFWLNGDIANAAFELFLFEALEHFRHKRYMLAVAISAQAWEVFFATFVQLRLAHRPFMKNHLQESVEDLNAILERLFVVMEKFTFFPLRNLFVSILLRQFEPATLVEAAAVVREIENTNFGSDISPTAIKGVPDAHLRAMLLSLHELRTPALRNRVLHKYAHRPSRDEAEECLAEHQLLYDLSRCLNLGALADGA